MCLALLPCGAAEGLPGPAVAEEHQEHREREEQEERPSCSPVTQHSGEQSRRVRAPPEHRPPLAGAAVVMDRSLYLWNCGGDRLQTPRWGFGFRLKHIRNDLEVPSPFKSEEPTRQPRLRREALIERAVTMETCERWCGFTVKQREFMAPADVAADKKTLQ